MRTVRLYKMPETVSILGLDGARNLRSGVYEIRNYPHLLLVVETGGWWLANQYGVSEDGNCRVEVLGVWNGSHPMGMT